MPALCALIGQFLTALSGTPDSFTPSEFFCEALLEFLSGAGLRFPSVRFGQPLVEAGSYKLISSFGEVGRSNVEVLGTLAVPFQKTDRRQP